MNLADIMKAKLELNKKVEENYKNYTGTKSLLEAELVKIKRLHDMALNNVDLDKIVNAERALSISGSYKDQGDDGWVIEKVIESLVLGDNKLFRDFYYTKNYEHFVRQGGVCEYGFGPKHGHIVFRVGLKGDFIKNNRDIDSDLVSDCIYLLEKLKTGSYSIK